MALLVTLLALQVYWFVLILKVAWGVVTKGKAEDVRSDDEEEQEEEKTKHASPKAAKAARAAKGCGKDSAGGHGKGAGKGEGGERPVKKCNAVLDALLGAALVGLIAWYSHHCYQTYDSNPSEALLFLGAVAFTIGAIVVVRYLAGLVGQWLTEARSGEGIPRETRDPLATPVAMKKFVDQAWQLAIHFGMSCWAVRIILQNPHWYHDPRSTLCCPGHAITASCVVSEELNGYFVLQLAMWLTTVHAAKREG